MSVIATNPQKGKKLAIKGIIIRFSFCVFSTRKQEI